MREVGSNQNRKEEAASRLCKKTNHTLHMSQNNDCETGVYRTTPDAGGHWAYRVFQAIDTLASRLDTLIARVDKIETRLSSLQSPTPRVLATSTTVSQVERDQAGSGTDPK